MFDTYEEVFAKRADSYQRAMATCPRARDAEFAAVIDPLDADAVTIFDMPAGAGYLQAYLPADKTYVAVEPTAYFFDRCPTGGTSRRIQSSIEQVPSADGSADAIVSLAGLHHAPDLGVIFREFRRLLRPGGMLVIADVGLDTPPDRFLNDYVHNNSPMGHDGRFLDDLTASLVRDAGFAVEVDETVAVPWHFADPLEAGAYCGSLFGVEGPSPDEVAVALAGIVGMPGDADGVRVAWTLRRIIARAV